MIYLNIFVLLLFGKIIKHYDIQNIRLINDDNRIFKYKRVRNIANYYTTGRVVLDFD